ncbi:MAG: AMP-binding protein [Notoacmeibacter sp.]|nr:AMP-binding protein [Notoacmeibacter sp.]
MTAMVQAAGRANLYGLFRQQVLRNGGNLALEDGDKRFSYAELDSRVRALAGLFTAHGLKRGDRVAILSENRGAYVEAAMAAALTGTILACQNWRLSREELQHCISLVSPGLVLVSDRNRAALGEIDLGGAALLDLDEGYEDRLAAAIPHPPASPADPEDGVVILYTSGTTGLPKGALISHRAEIARMCALRLDSGVQETDCFAAWAPMFHMASMDQVFGTLISGAAIIAIDGMQAEVIIDAARRHPLSWLVAMPGAIEPMVEVLKRDRPMLKRIACVGAMADLVPRQQLAELTALLGAPYLNSFGSTETGLPPASANLIAPGTTDYSLSKRISSLCEVRLVDPDGKEVAPGEPGELAIRGPTVFSGYWQAEETNARDFAQGWFRMGDLFRVNPDGTIDFVDRAKYMIKSGGENIYPAEIERVLLADPRVADAVVIRKADVQWGEVPLAFIARNDEALTAKDVDAICRARLAAYKRPRDIRFIALEDIPRSTTGKIQRHELEARLAGDSCAAP